ncbi:MAG: hydrogenase maturation peptidase HycI [Methanomicrobiaceae archaeon]|nr:hydrogenase maturation peptidase HycI [Methanomicrobiaceae archaeon]
MNILLGVGNSLLSDDGAGEYIAGSFEKEGWISYQCGTAPENFTSIVRKENPEMVLIIDAARMGFSPGEFRQIPEEKISGVSFGTHQLPLSQLTAYLRPYAKKIIIIGIEPKTTDFGESLSPEIEDACRRLLEMIEDDPETVPLL